MRFNWIQCRKTHQNRRLDDQRNELSDFPRGGAWPSSVRTAKRSVKSDNERDPYLYLPPFSPEKAHYRETAGAKPEEGAGNDRSVCPECFGLHACHKGQDNGKQSERLFNSKPVRSTDRGL